MLFVQNLNTMGKPAARVGDMHDCQLPNTPPPAGPGGKHSPLPLGPGGGVMTVMIGGKPAANQGTMCTCIAVPPFPNGVPMGSTSVFIGGLPAIRQGDMTLHAGGKISAGCDSVLIG
jgi:uncharacterized Zn-binding protein involved in type VI secretion